MKLVIQRVRQASVAVDGEIVGEIDRGILILLGIHADDTETRIPYLVEKCMHLRIFEDEAGKMNRSLLDVGGGALVVSQFTLYGDCGKGRRPSFVSAARPEVAEPLYEAFVAAVKTFPITVATGQFGADMAVSLVNDGPVTLVLE